MQAALTEHHEARYGEDADYRVGSPHLEHPQLFRYVTGLITSTLADARAADLPARVLEIGAGHGGVTDVLLNAGWDVTATELSGASASYLQRRYADSTRLRALHDPEGDLRVLGAGTYSVVVCSSLLHHIPDYMRFLERRVLPRISPGGCLVCVQDPLRYDTVPGLVHRLDRAAYLMWRLPRGHYVTGLGSLLRRSTGRYDESKPGDMVEYHVMRNGVDARRIEASLKARFDEVAVVPYWSNQLALAQRVGTRLHWANTFAVVAKGRVPGTPSCG